MKEAASFFIFFLVLVVSKEYVLRRVENNQSISLYARTQTVCAWSSRGLILIHRPKLPDHDDSLPKVPSSQMHPPKHYIISKIKHDHIILRCDIYPLVSLEDRVNLADGFMRFIETYMNKVINLLTLCSYINILVYILVYFFIDTAPPPSKKLDLFSFIKLCSCTLFC